VTALRDAVAQVTVSEPVDGTRHRRARSGPAPKVAPVERRQVHPLVMAAAEQRMRPGERLVVVDERTVRLVPS
jgi:hypothetical protein